MKGIRKGEKRKRLLIKDSSTFFTIQDIRARLNILVTPLERDVHPWASVLEHFFTSWSLSTRYRLDHPILRLRGIRWTITESMDNRTPHNFFSGIILHRAFAGRFNVISTGNNVEVSLNRNHFSMSHIRLDLQVRLGFAIWKFPKKFSEKTHIYWRIRTRLCNNLRVLTPAEQSMSKKLKTHGNIERNWLKCCKQADYGSRCSVTYCTTRLIYRIAYLTILYYNWTLSEWIKWSVMNESTLLSARVLTQYLSL
jgi:hypothetical protein